MLCLTRKVNQGLRLYETDGRYIGHIVVLGVDTMNRVRLGVEVDSRFQVLRDELLQGNNVDGTRPAAVDVSTNGRTSAGAE